MAYTGGTQLGRLGGGRGNSLLEQTSPCISMQTLPKGKQAETSAVTIRRAPAARQVPHQAPQCSMALTVPPGRGTNIPTQASGDTEEPKSPLSLSKDPWWSGLGFVWCGALPAGQYLSGQARGTFYNLRHRIRQCEVRGPAHRDGPERGLCWQTGGWPAPGLQDRQLLWPRPGLGGLPQLPSLWVSVSPFIKRHDWVPFKAYSQAPPPAGIGFTTLCLDSAGPHCVCCPAEASQRATLGLAPGAVSTGSRRVPQAQQANPPPLWDRRQESVGSTLSWQPVSWLDITV